MIDYLAHVRRDADRILDMATRGMEAAVPSCPGWTVADLMSHTGMVYAHKTTIVRDGWVAEQPEPIEPPQSDVLTWFEQQAAEMLAVLGAADPAAPAATWYPPDQTVGFWHRRMAHESLIHRLDAELAHDAVSPVDAALGADGIDEILVTMMSGAPEWAETTRSDRVITIAETDGGRVWRLRVGDFSGTSPGGARYDHDPALFLDDSDDPVVTQLRGAAGAVDAWLWGRAPTEGFAITGDVGLVALVRAVAADTTG